MKKWQCACKKGGLYMELTTERLILRAWRESDVKTLFHYAKDPAIGPLCGWSPHKDEKESLFVIQNVLMAPQCYAVCDRQTNEAIGSIELKLNGNSDLAKQDDECELGFWIGKEHWGKGYVTEAGRELIRHGFEDLGMQKIWCAYYDGNHRSKKVQEKLGFVYQRTCDHMPVALLDEVRIGHISLLDKKQWIKKD